MVEIHPEQYQNGDKQQGILIKRNITIYSARSYITEVFLCHSMFNTMTAFSANMFKNPGFDTLIMRENEGLIGVAQTKEI
ncbi:hypothetical protein ES703_50612 [subsurface metagenome]